MCLFISHKKIWFLSMCIIMWGYSLSILWYQELRKYFRNIDWLLACVWGCSLSWHFWKIKGIRRAWLQEHRLTTLHFSVVGGKNMAWKVVGKWLFVREVLALQNKDFCICKFYLNFASYIFWLHDQSICLV